MKLLLCIWPSSAFGPAENAEGDGLCVGSGDGILGVVSSVRGRMENRIE